MSSGHWRRRAGATGLVAPRAATGKSYSNKILAETIAQQIPGTAIEYFGEDSSASFEFDVTATIDRYQWHATTNFETGLKNYIQHANSGL